jgi:hypothetical protein
VGRLVRCYPGRAVYLGVLLQLNLPRTAGESNAVSGTTLSTKVSSCSIQRRLAPFQNPAGSQRNIKRRPKTSSLYGSPVLRPQQIDFPPVYAEAGATVYKCEQFYAFIRTYPRFQVSRWIIRVHGRGMQQCEGGRAVSVCYAG